MKKASISMSLTLDNNKTEVRISSGIKKCCQYLVFPQLRQMRYRVTYTSHGRPGTSFCNLSLKQYPLHRREMCSMLIITQSAANLVAGVIANPITSGDIVPDYAHSSDQVLSCKHRGGQMVHGICSGSRTIRHYHGHHIIYRQTLK